MEGKVKLISEKDKEMWQSVKFCMEHFFLQLRGVGKWYFVPVVVLYILLPILIFADYCTSRDAIKNIESTFATQCLFFMPVLSVWWVFLVMKEYIEGEGREVLYLNGHSKLMEVVMLYIYYVIHLIPFFWIASFFIPEIAIGLFFQMTLASFFYCGLGYLLLYLIKNIAIAFLPLMCYSMYGSSTGIKVAFLNHASYWVDPAKYAMEIVIAGCICFLAGAYLNKKNFL